MNATNKKIRIIAFLLGAMVLLAVFLSTVTAPKNSPSPTERKNMVIDLANDITQRNNRWFAIDINEATNSDFGSAFYVAQQLGINFDTLHVTWKQLEPAPGQFNPEPNYLAIANAFYPPQNLPLVLTVGVIDMATNVLPNDLKNQPLSSPEVQQRFKQLLDFIFLSLKDTTVAAISIGNEIDLGLRTADDWENYRAFFRVAADHIHSISPQTRVGVKMRFAALLGDQKDNARQLTELSDVVMVTYYPEDENKKYSQPSRVGTDFDQLTAMYPDKPIYILEAGFPTADKLDSSEYNQALFIHELFTSWDKHHTQIPLISFLRLHDWQSSEAPGVYGAFLKSLGLRTAAGEPKVGFYQLEAELQARGW